MIPRATRRYIRNPSDEFAARNGCWYDEAAADRVAEFFRRFLRHSKGEVAGQPFELCEWQRQDVISPLFGWRRPDGSRRFRKAYIELPKKNGKSTMAAGIGLYMLVGDGEAGSQVYSAATDRTQARIVHDEAVAMVDASPPLRKWLEINRATYNIHFAKRRSFYRALSAEAASKEGLDGHACIIDELHAWKGRALWDALRYMGRARRQPLIFIITTAGDDLQSVCWEQHEYARQVLDGSFADDRVFGYIRAATKQEIDERGLQDRALWRRANPSLGVTIREEDFAADVAEAARTPTSMSSFLRYSFNVWSTGNRRWLDVAQWRACRRSIDWDAMHREACYAGLDLASRFDTAACALIFPPTDVKSRSRYRLRIHFWLPEKRAEALRDQMPYLLWRDQGLITLTDGDVIDYESITSLVGQWARQYRIIELGFDPWNAEGPTQRIHAETGVPRVEISQTVANLNHAAKEFERLIVSREIEHDGHEVLAWQIGNCDVFTDSNGNIRPRRPPHEDARKIDGVAASVMALDRALRAPRPVNGSLLIV